MAAKRRPRPRPRRPSSADTLGRNGGNEGSDEKEGEESRESGDTSLSSDPKQIPLKQPSPKDAGAQGSGAASPARSAPRGGATTKAKTAISKRLKKPPPASQEEDDAGDSGDASPARGPLPDDTAGAGHNKGPVTRKRGEKRSPPPRQEEERPEKRAVGPVDETAAASAPGRKKKSTPLLQGEEQPSDTSHPQEQNGVQEDEETGAEVNAKASTLWSYDDEVKILKALVTHAKSHNGDLPESAHLLENLTFDKIDANEDKLNSKIRKLRARYLKLVSQGCPSDNHRRQLFKLSEILWRPVDKDERVEPTARDFSVLSKLYPHLAKEVKAYAETHSSGDAVMAMFMTIGDQKARELDAKCKKQQIEAFKLELGQASLTNELLSALSSLTRAKFY